MSIYLEFNHETLMADHLNDGPVLCMDALGNLRYRLLLQDGEIANGSLVTRYITDGRSDQQYIYHSYQPGLTVLEGMEKEESCLVGGAMVPGRGTVVGGKKWGKWEGDTFEGFYNNDQPLGSWVWDVEEELMSGEFVVTTKKITVQNGNPQAITDAPDSFRHDNEVLRQEARNRELAKHGS